MSERKTIEVVADWKGLEEPTLMGRLFATPSRPNEIFSFEYDPKWLASSQWPQLDPTLSLYGGAQYASSQRNFRIFLDSCPDRWGRTLMDRREAYLARVERRDERRLAESDYLLGVHDAHRMGALRFRYPSGPFLDDRDDLAAPPWTKLRTLEYASRQLEEEDAAEHPEYDTWRMLIDPGSSLGGARPKASVLDETKRLWIAKFPSKADLNDVGAWEGILHELARTANICTSETKVQKFGSEHHTFLSRRFDRTEGAEELERRHFASALTLLERDDGASAATGASYLELAEVLKQRGARTAADLEQLWRRILFNVCVSNCDDHLRNHGFLLERDGWSLAPAYDMNPDPDGRGLNLNISESDNAQHLELVMKVAVDFRVKSAKADEILAEVIRAVRGWRNVATAHKISRSEQDRMKRAFRIAESA